MSRPSLNEQLMKSALLFAERSTCMRVKAGAVIAVDNRIVSTGYNGNAPGKEHCCDHFDQLYSMIPHPISRERYLLSEDVKKLHHEWAIKYELHAEMNAIIYCARRGISISGGSIYTTYSPCLFCAKAIIHAGIKKVFYNKLYDRPEGKDSIEVLKDNGIAVELVLVEY